MEGLEGRRLLSFGGSPDLTFGTDGLQPIALGSTSVSLASFDVQSSATQSNGQTVVAGVYSAPIGMSSQNKSESVQVSRYNADGTLDTTFGTAGFELPPTLNATANVGDQVPDVGALGVAIQSDGKIDVAGNDQGTAFVFRLDADGTLDTTFGTGGILTLGTESLNSTTTFDRASTLAILPGGRIAVGGDVGGGSNTPHGAVLMLNADGSTDTGYGTAGVADVPLLSGASGFTGGISGNIAVQPDGSIIVDAGAAVNGGTFSETIELTSTRLTPAGALDTTYGTGGQVAITPQSLIGSGYELDPGQVAVQPDGKIVIGALLFYDAGAGGKYGTTALRLNADGTLDTSFGIGGADVLSTADTDSAVSSLTIDPDGTILLGLAEFPALARLDADGLPDPSFGTDGSAVIPSAPTQSELLAVVGVSVQSDGKILATLSGGTPSIARLLPTGSEGDYDDDGVSDPAVFDASTATFTDAPSGGGTAASTVIGDPGVGLTLPAPGAYDGGGITELAVYRPGPAVFDIKPYDGGADQLISFGMPGIGNTLPAPGDYDGSGRTELAAYFPSLGEFIYRPAGGGPDVRVPLGIAGAGQSIPAEADYFATGQDDFAVYLPAIGAFEIHNPVNNQDYTIPFGTPGAGNSIPVPGDYDGSGHAELAVYLPASGDLIYRPYAGGADVTIPIGTPGVAASIPEVGDFDGSSHDEAAVYNPATATFVYQPAAGGSPVSVSLGTAGETVPFSLGTDSVAEEGTGPSGGSAGAFALPATVPVPLTQDVLDTLNGLNLKKKAGSA